MSALLLTVLLLAGGQGSDAAQAKKDPNRIICRQVAPTGSKIASQKICATAAEWKAREDNAQDFLHRSDVGSATAGASSAAAAPQ
jgi:hypothetical protein